MRSLGAHAWTSLRAALAVLPAALAALACSSSPEAPGAGSEPVGTSQDSLSTTDALARAEEWVAVKLKYCQAPNGGRDYDAACSTYCSRQSNAQWDPYRSDCSGFVSWAWGLPSPGRVTGQFAPFVNDITHAIAATDLAPGDAVNNSDHVMLFKEWVTHGSVATFLEEPGCSSATPYAHQFTSNVSLSGNSISVSYNGMTFTAIRYGQLTNAPSLQGYLDGASCTELKGWAQDADTGTATKSIAVTLSFDAQLGKSGSITRNVTADVNRPDLCKSLGSCDHGFALPMPLGLMDGKAHTVYAYGVAPGGAGTSLLSQAPKTVNCPVPAIPPGVKRWVVSPGSLTAWKIDETLDVARVPQAEADAVPKGADLPATPSAIIADDGSSPAVWVTDGQTRRHVTSEAALAAWHLTAVKTPVAKINALAQGPDFPDAPFAFLGVGGPSVYVMDVAPSTPGGPGAPGGDVGGAGGTGGPGSPAPGGDGNGAPGGPSASDGGGSSGCAMSAGSAQGASAPWLALLGLAALARRRRAA